MMLALVLLACKGRGGDVDSEDVRFADADADGWSIDDGDCNDGLVTAFPNAQEACDGVDNDCDGETDEGVTSTYFIDSDGDGFGGAAAEACEQPENYVAVGGDCNDADATARPGVEEICDGQDSNCDGEVDEGVKSTFYKDYDQDGTGDPDTTSEACEAPEGYVDNPYDCDDRFADINELAPDICDGKDNDCDGTFDEDPDTVRYRDGDGDGHGDPALTTFACDVPEGYAEDALDCDDARAEVSPDAYESCNRVDDDCDGTTDEPDAIDAVVFYADGDGDGYGYAGTVTYACSAPSGYVADASDCDDGNAGISPIDVEIAYDGVDQDCDAADLTDVDGDGMDSSSVAGGKDCDDGDSTVYYGAPEYCDGADNDCDGSTDESDAVDPATWYKDADSDGYGDSASSSLACDQPTGYVSDATDCKDTDNASYPGATEVAYDGADQDCSGADLTDVDEDGVDAEAVAGGTDCDDGDSAVYPGAPETCDSVDTNCSGDETDASDATTWYKDGDGDGYGKSSSTTVDCSAPSGYVADSTDCDDAASTDYPGATETCSDNDDDDCDGTADDGCPEYHTGTISKSETWKASKAHYVTGDVTVGSSATLTIEDGSTVYFASGTSLNIGSSSSGALKADGSTTGITFTSSSSSPAPGDWDGIFLFSNNNTSVTTLKGITIEYAGANGSYPGSLYVTGSSNSVSVSDCTIQYSGNHGAYVAAGTFAMNDCTVADNAQSGVYLNSSAYLGTFKRNVLTGNTDYPLVLDVNEARNISDTTAYSGNGIDLLYLRSGTVSKTSTWPSIDVPYYVSGSTYVQGSASPSLTLSDGVEVRMAATSGFYVGVSTAGSLVVNGSSAGVVFTSAATSPAPGDWDRLYFGPSNVDGTTSIRGLTLEYGGYTGAGCVSLYYASEGLDSSRVQYCKDYGIYVDRSAYLTLTDTVVSGNTGYGVYVSSSGYLETTGISFSGNTLDSNDFSPIYLNPNDVDELATDNSFSSNGEQAVQVANGTVTSGSAWSDLGIPYHLMGDVAVSSGTLSLADGVDVYSDSGVSITISGSAALDVNGTATSGVLMSAWNGSSAGDWDGLVIDTSSSSSDIDYLEIEYGGGNGLACISVTDGTLTFNDGHVHDCFVAGVYLYEGSGADVDMTIVDSLIENNDGYGIFVESGLLGSDDAFTGNVVTGNSGIPMEVGPNALLALDASSTFTGNGEDVIEIEGGTSTFAGTVDLVDVPYRVTNEFTFAYDTEYEAGVTTTVASGQRVIFSDMATFSGTATAPVTFTSDEASPAAGDWGCLEFGSSSDGTTADYLVVEYGGGHTNCSGSIDTYFTSITLTNSTVQYSSKYGIYDYFTTLTASAMTYASNAYGDTN